MNAQTITLIAAIIAALTSIITLLITLIYKHSAEIRGAYREIVINDLNNLGEALHETLALSNLQLKASSDEIHKKRYHESSKAAGNLKKLRRKVRYSLWGIDNSLRDLSRLPDWIGHCRRSPVDAGQLYKLASELSNEIDKVVRKVYLYGRAPSYIEKYRVNNKQKKFRSYYEDFQIKNNKASAQGMQS